MDHIDFKDRPTSHRVTEMNAEYENLDAETVVLFLRFQEVARRLQSSYDDVLAQFDLSESKFIILMFLKRAGNTGLGVSTIAEKLGVTKATTSKLVHALVKQGFVTQTPSQADKRATVVKSTPLGQRKLAAFLPHNFSTVNTMMAELTPADRTTLTQLLRTLDHGIQSLTHSQEMS